MQGVHCPGTSDFIVFIVFQILQIFLQIFDFYIYKHDQIFKFFNKKIKIA